LRTTRRTAFLLFLPWVFALARSRPGSAVHHALFDLGIGFIVVCIAGAIATWRLGSSDASSPTEEPPQLEHDADTPGATRPVDAAERTRWAEATMSALWASELAGRGQDVARIAVIRVGAAGVELLHHEPRPVALSPFRASAGGLIWSLDPSIELEALIELGQDSRLSLDRRTPPLLEVGTDDEGSYFVPAGDIVRLRLDDDELGELHDELPSLTLQDWGSASGPLFGAPLVVVGRGEQLLLEPYGIPLPVSPESPLRPPPEPAAEAPSAPVPHPEPETKDIGAEDVEALVADGDDARPKVEPSTRAPLVPAGPVEVRILREEPDLVGELHGEPSAGAVEFVAFLALHRYRAAPARLRAALGTPRSQASRSGKTVWTSAGAARLALGTDLVPAASANHLYLLSEQVTCDWTRFQALVDLARSSVSDPGRRREALVAALELVDGVPGLASRRFSWLDSEGILSNIALAVLGAARELVNLEAELGANEFTRWAIQKAHLLVPDAEALVHQASAHTGTAGRVTSPR
jgi:hypothetical protein